MNNLLWNSLVHTCSAVHSNDRGLAPEAEAAGAGRRAGGANGPSSTISKFGVGAIQVGALLKSWSLAPTFQVGVQSLSCARTRRGPGVVSIPCGSLLCVSWATLEQAGFFMGSRITVVTRTVDAAGAGAAAGAVNGGTVLEFTMDEENYAKRTEGQQQNQNKPPLLPPPALVALVAFLFWSHISVSFAPPQARSSATRSNRAKP